MKIYKKYIFGFFLLFLLLLSFSSNTKAFDDIDYVFEREVLFEDSDPELNLFNMRPQQIYNGTYSGTYSFTNEIDGTSGIDINFIDNDISDVGCTTTIISEIAGHKKVIEIKDMNNAGKIDIYNSLSFISFGTFEFWIMTNNTIKQTRVMLMNDVSLVAGIRIVSAQIMGLDNGGWVNLPQNPVNNVWNLIRIDFESTNGGYLSLAQYTYMISTNGIYQDTLDYYTNVPFMDKLHIMTHDDNSDYISHIDAIGNSWHTYQEYLNFDNDIVGNEPIDWNINNDASCTSLIKASLDGRTNLLEMFDNNGNGISNASTQFNTTIINDITIDIASSDTSQLNFESKILFIENKITIISLIIDGHELYYDDGSGTPFELIKDPFLLGNNEFEVLKIVFNDSFNTFDCYINDNLEGNNLLYINNSTNNIDTLRFITDNTVLTSYSFFQDNININQFDQYNIGNNFQPLLETMEGFEGLLETDKYEFSFLDVNERAPTSATSFGLWNFYTTGEGYATIAGDGDLDRKVSLLVGDPGGTASIKRTALSITNSLVDVNIGFSSTFLTATYGILQVLLYASDTSLISGWKVDINTNDLSYWNGSWNVLRSDIELDTFYDINMFLNYDVDTVRMEYIVNSTFISYYYFDMVFTEHTGLYEIYIQASIGADQDVSNFRIDYVGLYRDGESWHGELGVITTPLNVDYHFGNHYLYSIVGKGRFHDGVVEGTYVGDETPFQSIRNISTISSIHKDGTLNTTNTGDFFWTEMEDATLVFTCVGSEINISSISIEGSKLTESSNEYFIEFSSSGLDSRDSYFYVSGSSLMFTYTAKFDGVLEYIQASFNINDESTDDTVVSFTSRKDGDSDSAYGFLRLSYDNTSQLFLIESGTKTKRIFLTPSETINEIIILISDTNKDFVSGLTTGYVKIISLLDVETASVSVVSSNLIDMIIPLILILIPTFIISGIYDKKLIVPMFIFMSVILTITNLIPVWLFFIIGLSLSLFVFFKKEVV